MELGWLSAWELRELVGSGEVSPVEVVEHYLARIEAHDRMLGSFATLDVDGAREQAKRAERAVSNGEQVGALHGIPISVKEEIRVAGLPGRGVAGQPGEPSPYDHPGVERLRRAGAVILGTNTMPGTTAVWWAQAGEWDGEPANPWDVSRVAGYSSSGGSVATAAGLVPIAIGSDGAGSTRLPPALCGVAGIHPTRGRIPHVDFAEPALFLTGSTGPIARDVRDVALTLQVMAGPDGRDLACMEDEPDDYLASIDAGVAGLRLAWTDDFGYGAAFRIDESERVTAAVRDAARAFTDLGAELTPTDIAWTNPAEALWATIRSFGYLGSEATDEPRPTVAEYEAAMAVRARNVELFRALFRDHDLLLSPTTPTIAPTLADWLAGAATPFETDPLSRPWFQTYYGLLMMFNLIGWPALTVPCGFVDGLPVGLQIVGRPGSEGLILRAARAFQVACPQEPPPL